MYTCILRDRSLITGRGDSYKTGRGEGGGVKFYPNTHKKKGGGVAQQVFG